MVKISLYLNVPFSDKDEAKKLGVLWNPTIKKWYVKNKYDYIKFMKWILAEDEFESYIILDHIYIVVGIRQCWKCGKTTRVIGFGIDDYIHYCDYDEEGYEYWEHLYEDIHILSSIPNLPKKVEEYISSVYNYKMKYSKTTAGYYMANCCEHCDSLQGKNYLYSEIDSSFFITDAKKAANLTLYKIKLPSDIIANNLEMSMSSTDFMIKQYAKIIELDQLY